MVDTGSTLTWISRALAGRLGLPRLPRQRFVLADGRRLERTTALAVVRIAGREAGVTVVLAGEGDAQMLGATSLESLGLAIDPIGERLVQRPMLALGAS